MVNGYPVEQYPFPKSNLRVLTTDAYSWEEARIDAGITRAEFEALAGDPVWITPNDPISLSKSDVVMSFYYRRLLKIVQEVEAYKKR